MKPGADDHHDGTVLVFDALFARPKWGRGGARRASRE